ncbi:hypothetical protein J2772_000377 [Chryseobacterium jejuense]|nr:hypothetical protein [Chryseobacterium jejuense]
MINSIELNLPRTSKKRFLLFLVTIVLVSYAEAQSVGDILLNLNYENGTLNP